MKKNLKMKPKSVSSTTMKRSFRLKLKKHPARIRPTVPRPPTKGKIRMKFWLGKNIFFYFVRHKIWSIFLIFRLYDEGLNSIPVMGKPQPVSQAPKVRSKKPRSSKPFQVKKERSCPKKLKVYLLSIAKV